MVFKVEEFDMMYMYVHEELIANYSTWNTAISPSKSSSDGLLVVSSSFSPPCPSPAASLSSLPSASVPSLSPSPPGPVAAGGGGGGRRKSQSDTPITPSRFCSGAGVSS